MRHCLLGASILSCFLCGMSAAGAEDKAEAKNHFNTAMTLVEKQDFTAAATELELSVKLLANKNNLYNLANCYTALHRYGEALALFERVLKEFDATLDKEMQEDTKKQIAEIGALVARLRIQATPPGAAISVDGKAAGATPLSEPLILRPGKHDVEVSLADHDTVKRQVTLVSGTDKTIVVELQKSKVALTIEASEAGAVVSLDGKEMGVTPLSSPLLLEADTYRVSVRKEGFKPMEQDVQLAVGEEKPIRFDLNPIPLPPVASVETPAPAAAQEKSGKLSPVFWVGLAGTVAFAGVSGAMWGMTVSKKNDYEGKANEINANMDQWDFTRPEDDQEERTLRGDAKSLGRDMEKRNRIAVGMTAVTGVFAVLTVVGLVIKRNDEEPSSAEIAAVPGGLQVRF